MFPENLLRVLFRTIVWLQRYVSPKVMVHSVFTVCMRWVIPMQAARRFA
jgi:hypothetical protein